jgi:hypothetical protein
MTSQDTKTVYEKRACRSDPRLGDSALTAKAKLAGMWRDRIDQHNTGSPVYERIERVIIEPAPRSDDVSEATGGTRRERTLTMKIERQPVCCTMKPPSVGPIPMAVLASAVQIPIAQAFDFGSGNAALTRASEVTLAVAAATPWTARARAPMRHWLDDRECWNGK